MLSFRQDEHTLEREVERLMALDLATLRDVWQARFGEPPPLRSVQLLRLLLAYRLQCAAHGDLDRATRRALAGIGAGATEGLALGIGARLTRRWRGRLVEVVVEPDGFSWEGRCYRSLSAAATAIAGSRWNGPRFFGLRAEGSVAIQSASPKARTRPARRKRAA